MKEDTVMTMLDYIYEQPGIVQDVLEKREKITREFCRIFVREMPDRLYLIASGTSCNGAKAAAPFMEYVLKRQVTVLPPSQLSQIYDKKAMLILISQGGKSTNTLAAADRMKDFYKIAMTGSAESVLDSHCEGAVRIPCGEELVGPKTKGYTTTILTLYLMALEAAKEGYIIPQAEYDQYIQVLTVAAGQMEENIRRSQQWMEWNKESLKTLSEIFLVGKGQGAAIALEGALKVMETFLIPGVGFEFEEYLHGPACCLRESTGGVYILPVPEDEDYDRIRKLVEYHRSISGQVYTIGLAEAEDDRDCQLLSAGKWYTKPFEAIIPLQLISAVIPGENGIDGLGMKHFKELDTILSMKYKA